MPPPPLLWLSAAFLCGLAAAGQLGGEWRLWAAAAILALALSALPRLSRLRLPFLEGLGRRLPLPLALVAAAFMAGGARLALTRQPLTPSDLAFYNDGAPLTVDGVVATPPDVRDRSQHLRISARRLLTPGAPGLPPSIQGDVLVVLPTGAGPYRYGDRLLLTGRLLTPPEDEEFSYRAYLEQQGILSQMSYPLVDLLGHGAGSPLTAWVYAFRQQAYEETNRLFPQPEAALLSGILLGLDNDLPLDLQNAYRDTGTAHIIAISGFNIAILVGLFVTLFSRLLRRGSAALVSAGTIAIYALMVGGSPSVVRAAIMGGLGLLAVQIGRRQAGLTTLAFTAAVMCLSNPLLPWDASFQLSFCATLGLVVFAAPMQAAFNRSRLAAVARRVSGLLGEYLILTLAAQITTLPVIAWHFQRISLVSFIANPLVLPPQPAVMVLGGLAALGGMLFHPLGQALAVFAWPLAAYTNRMVLLLAALPFGAWVTGPFSPLAVLLIYAGLLALYWLAQRRDRVCAWLTPAAGLAAAGLVAALVWRLVLAAPAGRLQITLLPLEGGPAVLAVTPGGQHLLFNGASRPSQLGDALGRRLPPFDRGLDAVLLTSSRAAAIEALPDTLERFLPAAVYWGEAIPQSRTARRLHDWAARRGLPQSALQEGQTWLLGEGASLQVLAAGEQGAAWVIEWHNFRALLSDGLPPASLGRSPGWLAGLSLTVLLQPGSEADWQDTAVPLVITAGGEDAAALPTGWVGTAAHGWVAAATDGKTLWVETER